MTTPKLKVTLEQARAFFKLRRQWEPELAPMIPQFLLVARDEALETIGGWYGPPRHDQPRRFFIAIDRDGRTHS